MIKILVVEDSPVVGEFLVYLLGADPDIRVADAFLRVEPLAALPPDGKKPVSGAIHVQEMS